MQKILVVGGAGYIGSHCAKLIHDSGMTPIVFDNFSTGHREAVKWGPCFEGDLLDRESLDRAFAQWAPDAVLHLAALALVAESVAKPELYWRANLLGTLNLLEVMRERDVKALVFSSTCAVYGDRVPVPIDGTAACAPSSPGRVGSAPRHRS